MKRDSQEGGYSNMKKDHWEKSVDCLYGADLKYSKGQFSNPQELKESSDKLAQYVKKNRMKH